MKLKYEVIKETKRNKGEQEGTNGEGFFYVGFRVVFFSIESTESH